MWRQVSLKSLATCNYQCTEVSRMPSKNMPLRSPVSLRQWPIVVPSCRDAATFLLRQSSEITLQCHLSSQQCVPCCSNENAITVGLKIAEPLASVSHQLQKNNKMQMMLILINGICKLVKQISVYVFNLEFKTLHRPTKLNTKHHFKLSNSCCLKRTARHNRNTTKNMARLGGNWFLHVYKLYATFIFVWEARSVGHQKTNLDATCTSLSFPRQWLRNLLRDLGQD